MAFSNNLLFSLLFFAAFSVYLFFGIYIIHRNIKTNQGIAFLAVCIALCFWSFGFSMANFAADMESCLFWRRVSALGWGSIYSLLLHYLLLLTECRLPQKHRQLYSLLYLPALISVFAFSISNEITAVQYNLVKVNYGWVNVAVQNGLTIFFDIYYVGYILACLAVVWNWKRRSTDKLVQKQARIIFISIAAALVLGSLTDVIFNTTLAEPLPQMAPLFILIPVYAIYYCMKHYSLMLEAGDEKADLILDEETRSRLHSYVAIAYIAGGLLSFMAYFFNYYLVNDEQRLRSTIYTSGLLVILGLIIVFAKLLKDVKVRYTIVLMTILVSIPLITLSFTQFAAITVWAFPLVLIIPSLVLDSQRPLFLISSVAILTQLLVWINAPIEAVPIDQFDFILRIGTIIIALWIGAFVNKTYLERLRKNNAQYEFHKLISEISFDFVGINQENMDEKYNNLLNKTGRYFGADRAYVFLIDQAAGRMSHSHAWWNESVSSRYQGLENASLDTFPWIAQKLNSSKLVYIEEVDKLPREAEAEKIQLTKQGVQSVVIVAIEENEELLGLVGLDYLQAPYNSWTSYDVDLLKIIANLLADGIIKIRAEKKIGRMAYYDNLTGLANKVLFNNRLDEAINLCRTNNEYLGVVFLDLDSFKIVNDTMGHSGGDTILKGVARALEQCLASKGMVARFGGDEFLIMVNCLTDTKNIVKVVDSIMEIFKQPFDVNGQEFYITVSAGVAIYPFDGEDAETLVKNADIAMYTAKAMGKNQYKLCTAEIKEEVKKNIQLSNNLYKALERNELTVHYQPQISLPAGEIVGFEALARWNHPQLGMILPGVFIPLAEMNGTIDSIGNWVLYTAICQNKKWHDMGYTHLRMAVNLSIVQVNNPRFVDNVEQMLKEVGLDPKYLELEVTESIATKEAGHIVITINKLKQLGISISIDDFGTEYSSFNWLKMLPINRIKIDRQFIQGIENSEKDQAITKIIINLAKSLSIDVLAEGVETMPQLEFLNQKLCDEVQGFYYYRPMPAEEAEKILADEKTIDACKCE